MEQRFIFRGNAVGAAGHITEPQDQIIWVQGASTLPVIGGYSQSVAERVKFGDALSVQQVRTQTTGDFSAREKAYKTLANSVVKGLIVDKRFTADSLEATFTSTYPAGGGEPSIVPTGTSLSNLRLDGYPIEVTLDTELFTIYDTREALAKAYATDDAFFKRYGGRFGKSEKSKPGKREIPEHSGYIVTTIVSEIKTKHPKAVVKDNVITLNGFGSIFLGELLINDISRRLTLVRLKLGSPITGEIVCAEVESNGIIIF